jgi:hypothetical protein
MAKAVKRKFSESVDGMGITVLADTIPGTLIHTAVSGSTPGSFDEVWLWAYCNDTVPTVIYVQFGDMGTPRAVVVDARSGLVPIIPGLPLQGARAVRVFAQTPGVIMIDGFVNRIVD